MKSRNVDVMFHLRITGAPYFDHYYTVFYYGKHGVGSTMGFATKNLGASAATSAVLIGSG
jgi:hypothetical protein